MNPDKVFLLRCVPQLYAWGKIGASSKVATLCQSVDKNFSIKKDTPYAELWMGTHPKGPSIVAATGQTLSEWIGKNNDCLGKKVHAHFKLTDQLPYLLKVLSVNKALSIQAHPNKTHAEKLHLERPDKYPDANHKPEMAIALTTFKGLCGFRPKEEIVNFLNNVSDFKAIIGTSLKKELENAEGENEVEAAVQKCFTVLMTCEEAVVKERLAANVSKIEQAKSKGEDTSSILGELFLEIHSQFPGDVGCFVIYFLNHMVLQPGEAMFLGANLPHAYLSGDCIECMACSDNVVRAGLTPKFKDVPTLCEMLNYSCKSANENLFTPRIQDTDPHVTIYNPPVPDFAVQKIQVPAEVGCYTISSLDSASIIIVIQGEAVTGNLKLQSGCVLFVTANETVPLSSISKEILMFRAYCPL